MNSANTSLTDRFLKNNEIAKKVAALLAENAVTVGELDEILKYVKDHLLIRSPDSVP